MRPLWGGIGDFVGARRRYLNLMHIYLERFGDHLRHFSEQALTHFSAAMIEVDAAIGVDMNECTCLVQMGHREGDPELDRRQCQAFFMKGALY